jgi:hypothetical protein
MRDGDFGGFMKKRGFISLEGAFLLLICIIILFFAGGYLYGLTNSRIVIGVVDRVTPLLEDGGMVMGENAARLAKSSAVSIKLKNGEYFTFSSEDRQWFTLKGEQKELKCVKAKAFPYAPWFFTKSGTYHSGRLLQMSDSCDKLN